MITTLQTEYTIDKNYIYKNPFEDLKELFKEKEKIRLLTNSKYTQVAFEVAKQLNEEGIATYDEELKIERNFKTKKTTIVISLKRKSELNQYFLGRDYFYKNIFEEINNYLKNHDKVTIIAKTGEVGIAFRVAKELVEKGIALYDEELKIERNFKASKGKTGIHISLKKKPKIEEYNIKKNEESSEIYQNMKKLFKKNEKITMVALPGEVTNAFKASKRLIDEGIAMYDEELQIKRNFKTIKGKTKIFISLKIKPALPKKQNNINTINTISIDKNSNCNEIMKKSLDLIKNNEKVNLEASSPSEVAIAFKVAQKLNNKGITVYDDELKINRNFKDEKEKTKIVISLKRKIKEYEIGKKSSHEQIVKDIKELLQEYDKIKIVALTDKIGSAFTAAKVLCDEGIAMYDEELQIKRNFKEGKGKTKALLSIKNKIKSNN